MPETLSCRQCSTSFSVDDRDLAFYEKMHVSSPTLCPDCRLQRRLTWRNERTMYMRTCDKTGKQMLSIFPPDSPYISYHHEIWFSDQWNALDYGRKYDFSRPFFEQFNELLHAVPLMGQAVVGVQNCEYVNQCGWSKNCYFTIEAERNENSMFGYRIYDNKTIMDCTEVVRSERCYECIDCEDCFNVHYAQLCRQCRDSAFLFDCRSCSDCFGCAGLRQKKFCMFNEQLGEEEYKKRLRDLNFSSRQHLAMAQERMEALKDNLQRKVFIGEQNESVSGSYIYECKDCFDCFNIRNCRECRYCDFLCNSKDCCDFFVIGSNTERVYDSLTCGHGAQSLRFCIEVLGGFDLTYCLQCLQNMAHCFGCIGLQKKEYCILNKQYDKEEYENLIPKIIEHMKKTGEWGEFFPAHISPFAYNETQAQEYFPLEKEVVLNRGWKWSDHLPFTSGKETFSHDQIPENIDDVPDSICSEVLACEATGKNFRITKQELLFYKKFRIPIPRLHPDERHRLRMEMRNPRKLWQRKCMKCQKEIQTTYSPERPEKVYCEDCYLAEVY